MTGLTVRRPNLLPSLAVAVASLRSTEVLRPLPRQREAPSLDTVS